MAEPAIRQRTGNRTSFKPGESGNSSGRPKRTAEEFELIAACRAKTPDALARIVQLAERADKDSVSLAASVFIIERAYGKALAKHEHRHNPLEDETTAMLLEMKSEIQERQQLKLVQQQVRPNEKEPSR